MGSESDCSHGLAIALADESGKKRWSDAVTACSGKTAVKGGTWRLPSLNDWEHMFIGCGGSGSFNASPPKVSYSGLADKLNTAAGVGAAMYTGEGDSYYWSSSVTSTNEGVVYYGLLWFGSSSDSSGNNAVKFGSQDDKLVTRYVRACLAF